VVRDRSFKFNGDPVNDSVDGPEKHIKQAVASLKVKFKHETTQQKQFQTKPIIIKL
jgi:hypothetical protein